MTKKKILIVEDNQVVGDALKLTISNMDASYEAVCVYDGYQALDLVRQTFFDLVITDYCMPGIDGLELRETIQEISPKTEIIVISAFQEDAIAQVFSEMSVENFLPKPFSYEQIHRIVKNTIAKVEAAQRTNTTPESKQSTTTPVTKIKEYLDELCRDTGALCCLLVEDNGFLIAQAGGDDQIPIQMLSSLTAANALATMEIANLLGNINPFKTTIHEGDDYNVACYLLENKTLLVIVFSKRTKIGLVQHFARQAVNTLSTYKITPTPHPISDLPATETLSQGVDEAFDSLLLDS